MGRNAATPAIIILVMGILGLFVAAMEQIAFDEGWILDLYLLSSEVPGLQIITIVLFLVVGSIIAALNS